MKRFFIVIMAVLIVFLAGCNKEENIEKEVKMSDNISDMEVKLDKDIFKLKDRLSYKDFSDKGYDVAPDYEDILEKELKVSKSDKELITESINVKNKKGEWITLSLVNTGKKKAKVKDCTIYFLSSYSGDEYIHSYNLPSDVKYGDSADEIEKKIGKAHIDLRNMEIGKMLQYIFEDGTFTANLDNNEKMTAFSYMLSNKVLFGE